MKKYIFLFLLNLFLLNFNNVYALSPPTPPHHPLIQEKLIEAAKECLQYSGEFAAPKESVIYKFYKGHNYSYIILDKSLLSCPGCLTCFEPSGGKYVSFFLVKKEGAKEQVEFMFDGMIVSYKIDHTQDKGRPFPIMIEEKNYPGTKIIKYMWNMTEGKYKRQE